VKIRQREVQFRGARLNCVAQVLLPDSFFTAENAILRRWKKIGPIGRMRLIGFCESPHELRRRVPHLLLEINNTKVQSFHDPGAGKVLHLLIVDFVAALSNADTEAIIVSR
jgi:hypothetical protein